MNIGEILNENQIIVTGSHFVYTSGLHGSTYINKKIILDNKKLLSEVSTLMARLVSEKTDFFVGPETGGAILAQAMSDSNKNSKYLIAKKYDKEFVLNSLEKVAGKKVIITEDVINTGMSIKKVIDLLMNVEAEIIGVVSMFNRGTLDSIKCIPIYQLRRLKLEVYEPEYCPLCEAGVPIDRSLGHG